MEFPERLTALRKARGLTQLALAEAIDLSVLQIRRYESGNSQPTLDVIRRLAVALGVSSDALVFDEGERGPDDVLRYQFETIARKHSPAPFATLASTFTFSTPVAFASNPRTR
ncbi:helix-turn-helix domain-containing protein [Paraburkholderia sp. WP4_3_2]|nr:helix-turn-helix transcriptional regulator [Paraburkholderia sp. WP4_3_2]